MPDNTLSPDLNSSETEELVTIARKLGFDKVANKLLGEEVEEEENEFDFSDGGSILPSQHSLRAVYETLRSMGCECND